MYKTFSQTAIYCDVMKYNKKQAKAKEIKKIIYKLKFQRNINMIQINNIIHVIDQLLNIGILVSFE